MHPLAPNLKDFTDEELMDKINEIYRKIGRTRGNYQLMNQLSMMLETYQSEFNARQDQKLKEALGEVSEEEFYSDKIDIS